MECQSQTWWTVQTRPFKISTLPLYLFSNPSRHFEFITRRRVRACPLIPLTLAAILVCPNPSRHFESLQGCPNVTLAAILKSLQNNRMAAILDLRTIEILRCILVWMGRLSTDEFLLLFSEIVIFMINGYKTSCRPIRAVIILVINKSDGGPRFCYHSYDYRPNWTPLSPITITC